MMNDPELQEIFTDPAHQEVVDLLKSARPALEPPLDPHFRSYLRAKLMTEAQRTLPRQAGASRPWFSLGRFRPQTLALSMAAVAAGFIVVLGVQVYLRGGAAPASPPVALVGASIANKVDVPTQVEPIVLNFSGPVDKNAVADSVVIEPATSVTKQWVGSALVITPSHQLAANTTYTVRLQPKAVATPAPAAPTSKPTPAALPTPVVVHFTTVRAPIPPVLPASFRSSNVTWQSDSRLAPSGTILDAVWTSTDQLLATRPAGQLGPGQPTPSASPTASASPSAASTTDVWLLSPLGTPLRNVAPGATLPSAPSTGALFAAWTITGGQAQLGVRDLQGNPIATVATINGVPDRPATWIGSTRLAYVDAGVLNVVDLQGNPVPIPTIKVDKGGIEASPNGAWLAVEGVDGSFLLDLTQTPARPTMLQTGATSFDWSSKGDLAFVVQHGPVSDLYVAAGGLKPEKIASSTQGQTWSDLNWSPDAASLLLATRAADGSGTASLLLINRDGSSPVAFGPSQVEYSTPEWSPNGSLVLFTRRDEATGGTTFQVATASTSGPDAQEQQALAEVTTFMNARLQGNATAAQAELDSNGLAAYQNGSASLLSASGSHFDRYYPITVQLASKTPSTYLVGVRTFVANAAGNETSFFEEQLTVLQQGPKYVIDDVVASGVQPIDHGPTIVSYEVVPTPSGQQVKVHFDSDLNPATVNANTIQVQDQSGATVPAQVAFDPENHLAILTVNLHPGKYQLVVTTGLTDVNQMALPQEYDAPLVISR